MGRPSKYTQERARAITDRLQLGMSYRMAALAAGISEDTFQRWRTRYAAFADSIEKAEADAQARKLARIEKAGREGTWQADAWWLERRYPQQWGKTVVQNEVTGKNGEPVQHEHVVRIVRDTSRQTG